MTSTLKELCLSIQDCTEKLEEEIKQNIDDCHKLLIDNQATEVKLALEKAKDYHYKEILDFLRDVIVNVRKIISHEEKIRTLNDENSLSPEELKRYSYVQRQIHVFSNSGEVVTKREKRRVASEVSLESLDAWELYLEKKAEEERKLHIEEKADIPKVRKMKSGRRKKKLISSTFNNFLDDRKGGGKLTSILEDSALDEEEDKLSTDGDTIIDNECKCIDDSKSPNISDDWIIVSHEGDENSSSKRRQVDQHKTNEDFLRNVVEPVDEDVGLPDPDYSKPKIVDVIVSTGRIRVVLVVKKILKSFCRVGLTKLDSI